MPEFQRRSLEILRQPLEERKIMISRMGGSYCFPAEFILVAAMNPCPCGHYPDMNRCTCTPSDIKRYRSKISLPLLDRIDICVDVEAVSYEDLQKAKKDGMTSAKLRNIVMQAQEIQKVRYQKEDILFNSQLPPSKVKQYCPVTSRGESLLQMVYRKKNLSARGYHRILRLARTIADLEAAEIIDVPHISEAVYYRGLDGMLQNEAR